MTIYAIKPIEHSAGSRKLRRRQTHLRPGGLRFTATTPPLLKLDHAFDKSAWIPIEIPGAGLTLSMRFRLLSYPPSRVTKPDSSGEPLRTTTVRNTSILTTLSASTEYVHTHVDGKRSVKHSQVFVRINGARYPRRLRLLSEEILLFRCATTLLSGNVTSY